MTTHAAMAVPRQPFSPLHSPRLQHLLSSKNRQNGASPLSSSFSSDNKLTLSTPPAKAPTTVLHSPSKRRLEADDDSENYDSENIDPSSFSKRSKNNDSTPVKIYSSPSSFNLTLTPTAFSFKCPPSALMPPPPTITKRLHSTPRRNNGQPSMPSPRAPLTAPAGRSPKARRAQGKNRHLSAPFSRIDPSLSRTSSSSPSALPFSLDTALAGTLPSNKSAPKIAPVVEAAQVETIQESMPSDWFFDIYEDAPGEEAANLMEHSTLTLDLSSDDETSAKNMEREDRGKENVAPEDYSYHPSATSASSLAGVAASSAGAARPAKTGVSRRKVAKVDDMDDGERSPLSDLETEDFFSTGLDKDSCILIPGAAEEAATAAATVAEEAEAVVEEDKRDEYCAVEKVEAAVTVAMNVPVLAVEGEILIWEDA